jgi:hypothetical protein
LAASGNSVPQRGQAVPNQWRHSLQKLALSRFEVWQFGQIKGQIPQAQP